MAGEANIWNPRTLIEVSGATKSIEERLTATEGQAVFTLTDFVYVVGTGALEVHKNGLLLTKGVEWVEQTATTFALTTTQIAGDQIVASGHVGITGNVDVRDTDIFVSNYQAIRDYAGTETTLYSEGDTTGADGGEIFFRKVTGASLGYWTDNGYNVLLPTGGNGTTAWVATTKAFSSIANLKLFSLVAGERVSTLSYYGAALVFVGSHGAAKYLVKTAAQATTDGDVIDNFGNHTLANGNVLILQVEDKIRVKQFGAKGLEGVDDTSAILAAFAKARVDANKKGGSHVFFDEPEDWYELSQPIDLNEHWNIKVTAESHHRWNRVPGGGGVETFGHLIHWTGNATDSCIDFGAFSFGVVLEGITVNGRNTLKMAFDLVGTAGQVARDIALRDCGSRECDFGIVLGNTTDSGDIANVEITNPFFTNCTSAAVLVNSGNASVNISGGFITNCGSAPTTGNSFIPDGDNLGYQLLQRAGITRVHGTIFDGASPTLAASGTNIKASSGSIYLNGWDDTPEVTSVELSGSVMEQAKLENWRHFDGAMTLANTPRSVLHSAGCVLELSGCALFGNVEINSGSGAAVINSGTRFMEVTTAGFTGSAIALGGLMSIERSGNNELVGAIGGVVAKDHGAVQPSWTVWCRANREGLNIRAREGGVGIVYSSDANGVEIAYQNCYSDAAGTTIKSIAIGSCFIRKSTKEGAIICTHATATAIDQTVTMVEKYRYSVTSGASGGLAKMELSGHALFWNPSSPAAGTFAKGSVCYNSNVSVGNPIGWMCTVAGTPGTWVAMANL